MLPPKRSRTKIIATLGDPEKETYKSGIYNLAREAVPETLDDIVELLFANGVDMIRLNLAHIELPEVEGRFRAVKKAIRSAEERHRRRIGVLADLGGPKIRLREQFVLPSETLYVHFSDFTPSPNDDAANGGDGSPTEWHTHVILEDQPFARAAEHATNTIFNEVRAKLREGKPTLAFIGDNDCTLEVREVREPHTLVCRVIATAERLQGKKIGRHKGFTVRGITKQVDAFTDDDREKLSRILRVDYEGGETEERLLSHVGISFCQKGSDVRQVLCHIMKFVGERLQMSFTNRDHLSDLFVEAPLLIAKIETQEGIRNLDEILDFADGVMIARGDLALEVEAVEIPQASKVITGKCNMRGKPVIMATQMLDSMKNNIEPTRPEATDVFNAVYDGADSLLLTGETSSGKYPAHAIQIMSELACRAEKYVAEQKEPDAYISSYSRQLELFKQRVESWQNRWDDVSRHFFQATHSATFNEEVVFILALCQIKQNRLQQQSSTDRISHAACTMASDEAVAAIVVPTQSGRSARMLSRFRPKSWIIALPHNAMTARKLQTDWGVVVGDLIPIGENKDLSWLIRESQVAIERVVEQGKAVIFTCGTPLGKVGTTNVVLRGEVGTPWVTE